jgi:hypothetical protein
MLQSATRTACDAKRPERVFVMVTPGVCRAMATAPLQRLAHVSQQLNSRILFFLIMSLLWTLLLVSIYCHDDSVWPQLPALYQERWRQL